MGGYKEYSYSLDQDPCGSPNNDCVDDSTYFWIRVYSANGKEPGCRAYSLQVTNGY